MFVVHNLTQRTVTFFQNLPCSWTLWMLLSLPQLVTNHFLVSLPKKQQYDMEQPFGHLWWPLKHQSADYMNLVANWVDLFNVVTVLFSLYHPYITLLILVYYLLWYYLYYFLWHITLLILVYYYLLILIYSSYLVILTVTVFCKFFIYICWKKSFAVSFFQK